jgi:hypothetical protein
MMHARMIVSTVRILRVVLRPETFHVLELFQ